MSEHIIDIVFPENYAIHPEYQVLHQVNVPVFAYTPDYVYAYKKLRMYELSEVRWNYITKALRRNPLSILDYGYGNGDFLKYCQEKGVRELFGYDVTEVPPPDNVKKINSLSDLEFVDGVCFFDSLEHCKDPGEIIRTLPPHNFVVITLPWCRNYTNYFSFAKTFTNEWFDTWHNKKGNGEHIFHFCDWSLNYFMELFDYKCIYMACPEDDIRIRKVEDEPNILVGIFTKKVK